MGADMRWWCLVALAACGGGEDGWVAQVYAHDSDVTVGELLLPGTHDSASYGCAVELGIAPGAGELLNTLWDFPPPEEGLSSQQIAVNWAQTQDRSVGEQLADGVRYVDLRVTMKDGALTTWHSVYSVPFDLVLDELVAFAADHRREVVIVSIGPSLADEELPALADALVAPRADGLSVCDLLLEDERPAAQVPLADVWRGGRPLVWGPDKKLGKMLVERGCVETNAPVEGHWSRTLSPEGVEAVLEQTVAARDPASILSNDFIFSLEGTPDVFEQLGFVTTYATLHDATVALGFSGDFPGRMIGLYPDMNVFAGDFYEQTDLVEAAVASNEARAAAR